MWMRCCVLTGALVVLVVAHGKARAATTFTVTNTGAMAYLIDGVSNGPLTLTRGQIYTFNVNTPGHPFWLVTARGAAGVTANQVSSGVTGNGVAVGTVTYNVPSSAPPTIFYQCSIHDAMVGTINIVAPPVPAMGWIAAIVLAFLALGAGLATLRRRAHA